MTTEMLSDEPKEKTQWNQRKSQNDQELEQY